MYNFVIIQGMKDARNRQNKTEEEVNELTNKLKTLEVSSILEE